VGLPSRVALVVPCFNERARLPVSAFCGAQLPGGQLELIFVNDGSTDGTGAVLEQVRAERAENTAIVSYDQNEGKAEAVRRGVLHALTRMPDAIGFWDADLATPLTELAAFVDVLDNPAIDIVIGSRVKLMGRTVERHAWRHYLGRVFATGASVALGLPVYDTQCGAKLFRVTPVLERIFAQPFIARWVFDVEILARFLALHPGGAAAAARSVYELPLKTWIDVHGSKVKVTDATRAAVDLARIRRAYRRACDPGRR
jgi:dolichyl-phosphate beta-glucosyltransferase